MVLLTGDWGGDVLHVQGTTTGTSSPLTVTQTATLPNAVVVPQKPTVSSVSGCADNPDGSTSLCPAAGVPVTFTVAAVSRLTTQSNCSWLGTC